mmetsp:Transcript_58965/g.144246  ORF Transcript_58965/g.144246 Transcript_58965/m.144246 type:complete len:277 (-) Transcript_58965:241-1071(-)
MKSSVSAFHFFVPLEEFLFLTPSSCLATASAALLLSPSLSLFFFFDDAAAALIWSKKLCFVSLSLAADEEFFISVLLLAELLPLLPLLPAAPAPFWCCVMALNNATTPRVATRRWKRSDSNSFAIMPPWEEDVVNEIAVVAIVNGICNAVRLRSRCSFRLSFNAFLSCFSFSCCLCSAVVVLLRTTNWLWLCCCDDAEAAVFVFPSFCLVLVVVLVVLPSLRFDADADDPKILPTTLAIFAAGSIVFFLPSVSDPRLESSSSSSSSSVFHVSGTMK